VRGGKNVLGKNQIKIFMLRAQLGKIRKIQFMPFESMKFCV
jgi:hypothetical protein